MKIALFSFILVLIASVPSPSWCETRTFHVGLTIPERVGNQSNAAGQQSQSQQVVRNNQSVTLLSYVPR